MIILDTNLLMKVNKTRRGRYLVKQKRQLFTIYKVNGLSAIDFKMEATA